MSSQQQLGVRLGVASWNTVHALQTSMVLGCGRSCLPELQGEEAFGQRGPVLRQGATQGVGLQHSRSKGTWSNLWRGSHKQPAEPRTAL